MPLKHYPILLIILPFITGIYIAVKNTIVYNQYWLWATLFLLTITSLVYFLNKKRFSKSKSSVFSFFTGLNMLLLGILYVSCYWDFLPENHFSKSTANYFVAEISSPPIEKAKSFKTNLKIKADIDFEGEFSLASGNAIVYLEKDSLVRKLNYSNQIIIPNKFSEIKAPKNPYEFDYKLFLKHKNTFYQAYFRSKELSLLSEQPTDKSVILMKYIYRFRAFLFQQIKTYLPNDNAAVAAALLLGDKQLLHKDLQLVYQDTGAMHILAVSGLHVGIISEIVLFLLQFLNRFKRRALYKSVSAITILWLFACLTGLAPSVTRATLMFSILIIGRTMSRPIKIYNSLAFSAFLLLIYNPLLIMELGFQLSYLAVIGIVLFHPKIMAAYRPENKYLYKIWELNGVAASAQLLTLPLTIATFHQFPIIFILSNPIAILGATVVLGFGLFFFLFAVIAHLFSIPILAEYGVMPVDLCLYILNFALNMVQQIPYGTIKNLFISNFQFYILSIVLLFFSLHFWKKTLLKVALFFAFIFTGSMIFSKFKQVQGLELSIFHIPNNSAVALRAGTQMNLIHSLDNDSLALQQLKNPILSQGISQPKFHNFDGKIKTTEIYKNKELIQIGNTKILTIHRKNYFHIQHWEGDVQYVLVKENPFLKIGDLYEQLKPEKLIFDGSNSQKTCNFWLAECEQLNLPCHFTATDGAFTVILEK